MFHVYFLNKVAQPPGRDLQQIRLTYNANYGRPTNIMKEELQAACKAIHTVKGWDEFFRRLSLRPCTPETLCGYLKSAMVESAQKYRTRCDYSGRRTGYPIITLRYVDQISLTLPDEPLTATKRKRVAEEREKGKARADEETKGAGATEPPVKRSRGDVVAESTPSRSSSPLTRRGRSRTRSKSRGRSDSSSSSSSDSSSSSERSRSRSRSRGRHRSRRSRSRSRDRYRDRRSRSRSRDRRSRSRSRSRSSSRDGYRSRRYSSSNYSSYSGRNRQRRRDSRSRSRSRERGRGSRRTYRSNRYVRRGSGFMVTY